MKTSNDKIWGFDNYASILDFDFCLLNSDFKSSILNPES